MAPRTPHTPRTPSYRLHKASGLAVVTLNGRDVYLGKHGSPESHAAYERAIAEWRSVGLTRGGNLDLLTIDELILAYWRHCQTYYVKAGEPTSEQHLIKSALRRLRRLYGGELVGAVTPQSLKAVRQVMIDEGLSRRTINGYVSRVVACFRWGVEEGLVSPTVLEGLRAVRGLARGRSPARETPPVGPVADAIIEATLSHLPEVVADMVRVQRLTGMRPGEVCAMRRNDLDTSGTIWIYRPADHKTSHHGHDRLIPIGPQARSIIARHLRPCQGVHVFVHTSFSKAGTAMPYTTSSYCRAVTRACERADVPRWTPNQLRHARATEIRRTYGLDGAGAVLGHTKLETTQVYAERAASLATRIAAETG